MDFDKQFHYLAIILFKAFKLTAVSSEDRVADFISMSEPSKLSEKASTRLNTTNLEYRKEISSTGTACGASAFYIQYVCIFHYLHQLLAIYM